MYTIIPELVSIETKLKKITGFYLSENFGFFDSTNSPLKFHYKIEINNNFKVPKVYDFRNGYYTKHENCWYYHRKIGPIELKFKYDQEKKLFQFNSTYQLIPFEVGGITQVGRHIGDIINLELFFGGLTLIQGCGININEKTICLIGMGYNGKTSFTTNAIEKGGKYIAEDIIVLDLDKMLVYPTAICKNKFNFARHTNRELGNLLDYKNKTNIVQQSKKVDNLFLIQNVTNPHYVNNSNTKLYDFLFSCSLSFLKNTLAKSYILNENLTDEFFKKIEIIREFNKDYESVNLRNFNFSKIYKTLKIN